MHSLCPSATTSEKMASVLIRDAGRSADAALRASAHLLPCVPLHICCCERCCYVGEAAGLPLTCLHSLSTSGQALQALQCCLQAFKLQGSKTSLWAAAGG